MDLFNSHAIFQQLALWCRKIPPVFSLTRWRCHFCRFRFSSGIESFLRDDGSLFIAAQEIKPRCCARHKHQQNAIPERRIATAAPPVGTTCATAPPAPSLPEISLAASSSCTAQSRSSSLVSSVSFFRHSNLTGCGKQRA